MSDGIIGGLIGGMLGIVAASISGFFAIHAAKKQIKASIKTTRDQIEANKQATEDQIEATKHTVNKQIEANEKQMLLSRAYSLRNTIEAKLSYIFTKYTVQTMLKNENDLHEIWRDSQISPYIADLHNEPVLGKNLAPIIESYFSKLLEFSKAPDTNKEEIDQLRHSHLLDIIGTLNNFTEVKKKLINEEN